MNDPLFWQTEPPPVAAVFQNYPDEPFLGYLNKCVEEVVQDREDFAEQINSMEEEEIKEEEIKEEGVGGTPTSGLDVLLAAVDQDSGPSTMEVEESQSDVAAAAQLVRGARGGRKTVSSCFLTKVVGVSCPAKPKKRGPPVCNLCAHGVNEWWEGCRPLRSIFQVTGDLPQNEGVSFAKTVEKLILNCEKCRDETRFVFIQGRRFYPFGKWGKGFLFLIEVTPQQNAKPVIPVAKPGNAVYTLGHNPIGKEKKNQLFDFFPPNFPQGYIQTAEGRSRDQAPTIPRESVLALAQVAISDQQQQQPPQEEPQDMEEEDELAPQAEQPLQRVSYQPLARSRNAPAPLGERIQATPPVPQDQDQDQDEEKTVKGDGMARTMEAAIGVNFGAQVLDTMRVVFRDLAEGLAKFKAQFDAALKRRLSGYLLTLIELHGQRGRVTADEQKHFVSALDAHVTTFKNAANVWRWHMMQPGTTVLMPGQERLSPNGSVVLRLDDEDGIVLERRRGAVRLWSSGAGQAGARAVLTRDCELRLLEQDADDDEDFPVWQVKAPGSTPDNLILAVHNDGYLAFFDRHRQCLVYVVGGTAPQEQHFSSSSSSSAANQHQH